METAFDLNLVRLLVALADAGSVSRAARRLGVTQPGLSTALARARRQLGDELFVRTPQGMQPTARARRAIEAARSVLETVREGILEQPGFDPASWRGQIQLAMQDVSESVFLPSLLGQLQRASPGATVRCVDLAGDELQAALAAGAVDLAIGYFPELDVQPLTRQRLYLHTYACIVRRGHPVLATGLDLAAYRELGHVVVTTMAATVGAFRHSLAARRIERKVAVELPHVLSIPAVVADTDLVATVPLAVAESFARDGRVVVLPVPFAPTRFEVRQYWHRAFHRDPRITWLRRQVAALFNDQSDRWRALEESLYGRREPGQARRPTGPRAAPRPGNPADARPRRPPAPRRSRG